MPTKFNMAAVFTTIK